MLKETCIKRFKANQSEFVTVWPGLKRCMQCGFAMAIDEDDDGSKKRSSSGEYTLHSTYHGKFWKALNEYGQQNLLPYKELLETIEALPFALDKLKNYDLTSDLPKIRNYFSALNSYIEILDRRLKDLCSEDNDYSVSPEVTECLASIRKCMEEIRILSCEVSKLESNMDIMEKFLSSFTLFRKIQRGLDELKDLGVTKDLELSFDFDMETLVQDISAKIGKVEGILHDVFRIEFTKSMRLWDMCKPHPAFDDYKRLLWNTPKFIKYIRLYMTDEQLKDFIIKNKANRCLVDSGFNEAPFFFGSVMETSYADASDAYDLSHLDRIANAEENEEDTSDGFEESSEYEDTVQVLGQLGSLLNKK